MSKLEGRECWEPDGQIVIIGRKAPASRAAQCSGSGFVLQVLRGYISDQRVPGGLDSKLAIWPITE